MKKRWVALAVAMLLIAAVASALAGDPTEVDVTVTYGQSEARSMLAMINEFRASEDAWYWDTDNTTKIVCDNLQPLVYDYDLEAAAMQRAAEVALTFQHTRPDGTSCFTAFPTISAAGENIAAGYGSAQSAYVGWREDDLNYSGQGHRRNMLSSNFNAIGIGHVVYNGCHYWTQALGKRSSPTTADPGAANSAKTVTVAISWSNVTAVSAGDVTLEFGASAAYPEVSYQVSGAWPAGNSVVYVAHNAADQLAWTAADPTVLTLGETQAVAQNAGQTTLKTTVFGQEVTSSVTVNPKNLSGATVTPAATGLVYTGIPQTPEVTVQLGTQTLTKDQDYTVSWANNTAATAAATVTVTGKGNYTGTAQSTFAIAKAPLTVTANANTITYGDSPAGAGVTYSGFVGNDNEGSLSGDLSYTYSYAPYGNVGEYTVTPAGLSSDNYNITFAAGKLSVVARELRLNWGETDLSYTGTAQVPALSLSGLVNNDAVQAAVSGAQTEVGSYTATVTGLTGAKAGNYRLPAETTVAFRIVKAQPAVTAPTPQTNLIYNGTAQQLVIAGSVQGGVMQYSLAKEGTYAEEIPTATEVGTYTVWYRVYGDENHLDVAPQSVKAVIQEKIVSEVIVDGGLYTLGKKEAVFTKATKSSVKTLTIAATVSANGKNYPVTEIAAGACKGLKSLTTVTIGKRIKTIGKNAFNGCVKLKTVKGGAAVVTIKDGAFSGCKALKTFPAMSKLQTIGANAFKGCVKLTTFTLGKAVKSIGKNAFNGCKALKTITVKTEKLTTGNVKAGAFKGIHSKATFKCPKKKLSAYKTLFVKRGAPKTCKFK